jgi:hypothetical protein
MGHGITIPEQQKIDNPKRKKKTKCELYNIQEPCQNKHKSVERQTIRIAYQHRKSRNNFVSKELFRISSKKSKTRSNY